VGLQDLQGAEQQQQQQGDVSSCRRSSNSQQEVTLALRQLAAALQLLLMALLWLRLLRVVPAMQARARTVLAAAAGLAHLRDVCLC
jgi:hypothetical protein